MGRRVAKTRTPTESVEDLLQLGATSDDHAGIDRAQIEQEPKVVQVPIVERVLVVPLDFERHAVFVAVHLVRGRHELGLVHDNARVECLFDPAEFCEVRIQPLGNKPLGSAGLEHVAFQQDKVPQHFEEIRPFPPDAPP